MTSGMNRALALLVLAAGIGLVCATWWPGPAARPVPAFADGERLYGALLGVVDCDRIPVKLPEPWEKQVDQRERPYHLLVQAVRFRDLSPLPLDASQVSVPGVTFKRQVSSSEVLCEGLELGLVPVNILEPGAQERAVQGPPVLASRNPVPLCRHALTRCQVVMLEPDDLTRSCQLKGRVYDRFTGEPLEGVLVHMEDGSSVTTGPDGSWAWPGPRRFRMLFSLHFFKQGYDSATLSPLTLSRSWAEHYHQSGEAVVTLRPDR